MLAAAEFGLSHTTNAILLLGEVTGNNASPKAWYMLGRCYDEIGNREKASEAYRKALETFGTTTIRWLQLIITSRFAGPPREPATRPLRC
jgi:Flp pilus assembly protein TadD